MIRGIAIVSLLAVSLAACAGMERPIIKNNVVVVVPPEDLYNCPQPKLPTTADLKNKDVATLIKQFYQANRTCKISQDHVRSYVQKAKVIYGVK